MFKAAHLLSLLWLLPLQAFCQEDLLSMVDQEQDHKPKKVYATFKTLRLGNAQTVECVKKKHLDFRISHRFGNIYDATQKNPINETFQSFLGFDNVSDVRVSLDYGLLDNVTLGIGRSQNKLVDGSVKWKILSQTADFSVPVTVTFFSSMGYSHLPMPVIYGGINKNFKSNELHRLNYFTEVIIASKINDWLSLELLPAYMHRNFIREDFNTTNGAQNPNAFFTLGFGGRMKLTNRLSIIGDYYYNFGDYYADNARARNPLALGCEIETGGHVFSLFFTNAGMLVENNFILGSSDSWSKGQVKFGFSISRTFAL